MTVRELRAVVRKAYPHVKLTVRAGTAYIEKERNAGERSTINQYAQLLAQIRHALGNNCQTEFVLYLDIFLSIAR